MKRTLRQIFSYYDQTHRLDLHSQCMSRWTRIVLEPFKERVFSLIMDQITSIRDGQEIGQSGILGDVLKMMGELGVYYSMFERGFLEASTLYYTKKGSLF
jgi:hypothetical protein